MCTSLEPSNSDDGVWDDSGSEREASTGELQREGALRGQQFFNSGYREGVDDGKEQTLQEGFNLGFHQGAQAGFEWGCLKGAVKTLRIMSGQFPGSSKWSSQVQSMGSQVDGVRDREAMLGTLKQLLLTPLADVDIPQAARADAELLQAFMVAIQKSQQPDGLTAAEGMALPDMAGISMAVRSGLQQLGFASDI